jgi:hypothetical protein
VNTPETGTLVGAEEAAERKAIRERLSPVRGLDTMETFDKWLFATVAVVGTLGTAFSLLDAGSLSGDAQTAFGVAVALTGVSLACAALALAPRRASFDRESPDSMREAIRKTSRVRFWSLSVAAVAFAAALVLAGLAPLISDRSRARPAHGFTHSVDTRGFVRAKYQLAAAEPRTRARLLASVGAARRGNVRPRVVVATDARGEGAMELTVRAGPRTRRVVFVAKWVDRDGKPVVSRAVVPVARRR